MTSKSSKALPYLAALILIGSLWAEVHYGVSIDLQTAMPFLMAIGLGGAGLKAMERASNARKQLPSDLEKLIKECINEAEATLTARIDSKIKHRSFFLFELN